MSSVLKDNPYSTDHCKVKIDIWTTNYDEGHAMIVKDLQSLEVHDPPLKQTAIK